MNINLNMEKTIICGYAKVDGWSVGIVANNRAVTKSGKGEMQVGGVIYSDSADKAARFIMNCNQRNSISIFSRCYWLYGWYKSRTRRNY